MFRVLDLTQREEWQKAIVACEQYDFYHTYDYHLLSYNQGEGSPKLFVLEDNDETIALPLLERTIAGTNNLKDLTSVYGYGGPVYSSNAGKQHLEKFQQEFKSYLLNHNIVSVFSRMHPLISQDWVVEPLGELVNLSKTVTIELALDPTEQRKKYRKSNKSEINKLRRTAECKVASTSSELEEFIEIYLDNMRRLEASKRYFFSRKYFDNFLNAVDFDTEIVLAVEDDTIMAGAIFAYTNDFVQYHLAGTKEKYFSKTPMKLILDDVRLRSLQAGYKYFHLGGGVGSQEDSLFKFKSGFSDRYDQFKLWRYVVDQEAYDELVAARSNEIKDQNFFPLYRG